nr:MAG TPA: hypothetical protein [Caudoviricetes sp.]
MATARQATEFIADALRILIGIVTDCQEVVRAAGLIPATPGIPAQIGTEHVATMLLSALLGSQWADGHAERVAAYSRMRPIAGGSTFGQTLAAYIDKPINLFEIRIDAHVPGAAVTYRQANGGMAVQSFVTEEPQPRPAFGREVILGPAPLIQLAASIESAPIVKAGRPRERDCYRRVERAVLYN